MKKLILAILLCLLPTLAGAQANPPVNVGNYLFFYPGCTTYPSGTTPPVKGALCSDTTNGGLYVWNGTAFVPSTGATNAEHSTTVSGPLTYALQPAIVTFEVFTFTNNATVTLPQGAVGQTLNAVVCQNVTGGFTPTFVAAGGLTIVGTFPTFTTTASKCGDFSLHYTTPTLAYLVGNAAGPL